MDLMSPLKVFTLTIKTRGWCDNIHAGFNFEKCTSTAIIVINSRWHQHF